MPLATLTASRWRDMSNLHRSSWRGIDGGQATWAASDPVAPVLIVPWLCTSAALRAVNALKRTPVEDSHDGRAERFEMPIKTILTYRNGFPSSETQMEAAISAARRFDAHLSVATIGYEPEMPFDAYGSLSGVEMDAELRARAEEDATALASEVTALLASEGIRGDAFPLVTTPSGLARDFGRHARYTDLVVLSRPTGDGNHHALTRTFEGALFHGDAAVLVCPEEPNLRPGRGMIAWDGGPAALRSIRRAYPVMEGLTDLDIVLVDAGAEQMHSAEDLARMLSRYGLSLSITRVASDERTDAEALSRHQVESGAELIIAGAYGHSRFRELLLGGVTRDLPAIAAVPVFMAH